MVQPPKNPTHLCWASRDYNDVGMGGLLAKILEVAFVLLLWRTRGNELFSLHELLSAMRCCRWTSKNLQGKLAVGRSHLEGWATSMWMSTRGAYHVPKVWEAGTRGLSLH